MTYWCMPAELTLFFFFSFSFFLCFHFFSSLYFLFFFLVFYFMISLRWLLLWFLPFFLLLFLPLCAWQGPPFIAPAMVGFYCFSPSLSVLADHHWTVCVPFPITRQRRLFCLLVSHGTPSCYGVGVFSLLIPHDMHLVAPA